MGRGEGPPPAVTIEIDPKEDDDESYDDDDDPLGYQGDYECTRHFGAKILVNGAPAGSLSAVLVNRSMAGSCFHSACDAESGELQEISCLFFGSSGQPRYTALKSDASAKRGGFLYLATFEISAEHRVNGATDIGSAAIKALLSCAEVSGRWSVAAYIADSSASLTPAEKSQDRAEAMERMHAQMGRGAHTETPADRAARVAKIHARMAADCRQFLRAGFAEAKHKDGGWLFITKDMLRRAPPMSHEAALAVPLRLTPAAGGPGASASASASGTKTAEDERLLRALIKSSSEKQTAASQLAQIDAAVAGGADLTRAAVLQCCAANGTTELIQPLLARGADINSEDEHGCTPLMIAAQGALRKLSLHQRTHDSSMISHLLALGADKGATDPDGCSALGHYFKAVCSMNDFNAALIGGPKAVVDQTVVAMLTPAGGPTTADKECADDH